MTNKDKGNVKLRVKTPVTNLPSQFFRICLTFDEVNVKYLKVIFFTSKHTPLGFFLVVTVYH